jgi:hypothetical protein
MRMALTASTRDERIRLVEQANEYRHKASQAELLPRPSSIVAPSST